MSWLELGSLFMVELVLLFGVWCWGYDSGYGDGENEWDDGYSEGYKDGKADGK